MTNTTLLSALVLALVVAGCTKESPTDSLTTDTRTPPIDGSSIVTLKPDKSNIPPTVPSNPMPANVATGTSTDITLSWTCSDPNGDPLRYTVSFGIIGTSFATVKTNDPNGNISFNGLANNTAYCWKVDAIDSAGALTSGPVWTFTTKAGVIPPGMTAVPGGGFTLGPPLVTMTGFKIDKFEVTYELWTEVRTWALAHGYTDIAPGQNGVEPVGANNPVTMVTWYDVVKWCNARSERSGLMPVYCTEKTVYRTGMIDITGYSVRWGADGYRLPTEAEWEFAARGGAITNGFLYSGGSNVQDVAWSISNSGNATHTVGQKQANELGIYDMSGNAAEWCWDWYAPAFPSSGGMDPIGPLTAQTQRVVRGGSIGHSLAESMQVTYREHMRPGSSGDAGQIIGFRCVRK